MNDREDEGNLTKDMGASQHLNDASRSTASTHHRDLTIEAYRESALRRAFHQTAVMDDLVLLWQARVSPAFQRIAAVAVKPQWNHADWGLIPVSDIADIVREHQLAESIETWTLLETARQLVRWRDSGLDDIRASVNICAEHFVKDGFAEELQTILHDCGLSGAQLEIVISEDTLVVDEALTLKVILRLQEMEVRVAMDDYGSGYCSLSQLKRYRISAIRLAKSSIRKIGLDSAADDYLHSTIDSAHVLGLTVTAKSVESPRQVAVLRQTQCDDIQGHYYGAPVSANEFDELLRKRVLIDREDADSITDRREHYRIQIRHPLIAEMTLTSVNGSPLEIGGTPILITDIGPGGLRFISPLRLPVNRALAFEFRLSLFGELAIDGHLAWTNSAGEDLAEYGVEWVMRESSRADLMQRLNRLSTELMKRSVVNECEMFTGDPERFFRLASAADAT